MGSMPSKKLTRRETPKPIAGNNYDMSFYCDCNCKRMNIVIRVIGPIPRSLHMKHPIETNSTSLEIANELPIEVRSIQFLIVSYIIKDFHYNDK